MAESKKSKQIREVVKLADKLVRETLSGLEKLRKAARDLKGDEKEER